MRIYQNKLLGFWLLAARVIIGMLFLGAVCIISKYIYVFELMYTETTIAYTQTDFLIIKENVFLLALQAKNVILANVPFILRMISEVFI